MQENPNKQAPNRKLRDEAASVVASVFKLTPRAVRMVINGETTNEPVLEAVITYKQGKSKLIEEIEKLVPFNN